MTAPTNPLDTAAEHLRAAMSRDTDPIMAALHLAIATLASAGDHIVASSALYGGTVNLLARTLPRFGVTTTFVPPRDHAGFAAAIRPETRLVLAETIGNPNLEVLDIEAVAGVAHAAGVPLLIDSTFATPYLCRPIDFGADIVMHSLTKWIGGHGRVLGGVLVDAGRFDWRRSGRHKTLVEPYEGYHGLNFADDYGPAAFIMRARVEGLRDFGAALPAASAATILLGVETLGPRMDRHVANALTVVAALRAHEAVAWVAHPSLADHPDAALARRLMPRGAGSIVTFGIRGGREAATRFIESVKLASHLANVGDAKTLVIHPASTTHAQLDAEALAASGVGEDLIRLSIGLEDAADIVADLEQALKRSQPRGKARHAG